MNASIPSRTLYISASGFLKVKNIYRSHGMLKYIVLYLQIFTVKNVLQMHLFIYALQFYNFNACLPNEVEVQLHEQYIMEIRLKQNSTYVLSWNGIITLIYNNNIQDLEYHFNLIWRAFFHSPGAEWHCFASILHSIKTILPINPK